MSRKRLCLVLAALVAGSAITPAATAGDVSRKLYDRGDWVTLHHRFDDGEEACESFTGTARSGFHVFTSAIRGTMTIIIVHDRWHFPPKPVPMDLQVLVEGHGTLTFTGLMSGDSTLTVFDLGTQPADDFMVALGAGRSLLVRTLDGTVIDRFSLRGSGGAVNANHHCLTHLLPQEVEEDDISMNMPGSRR